MATDIGVNAGRLWREVSNSPTNRSSLRPGNPSDLPAISTCFACLGRFSLSKFGLWDYLDPILSVSDGEFLTKMVFLVKALD